MKVLSLMLVLLGSCALAQEPLPVLDGSWTASLGSGQIFRGTWSAQTSPQNLNAARGSWTVLNEAGEIAMEGTRSAQNVGQGWQGTWTVRAHRGAALSGTWNADLASFSGKTIHAMLRMIPFGIVLQSSRLGDDRRSVALDGGGRAAVMSYPFASAVTIINAVSMPQWCARP